jgi:arylsulfatase A-like enzyme
VRKFSRIIILILLGATAILWQREEASAGMPPNFIILLADDMGYGDWGPYDHDNNPSTPMVSDTPNLDQMAAEGVTLTDFYVSASVCSPVRSTLLTGRHQINTEITRVLQTSQYGGLPFYEETLPERLAIQGYQSAAIGKWHQGVHSQSTAINQGFDHFFGIPYSNDSPVFYLMEDETIIDPDPNQEELTQLFTIEARQFISESVALNQPFFLYVPYTAPHVPLYPSAGFQGTSPRGIYGDMVRELDWSVGEIINQVDSLGIGANTFILFIIDVHQSLLILRPACWKHPSRMSGR